jgi:hypothetical protein
MIVKEHEKKAHGFISVTRIAADGHVSVLLGLVPAAAVGPPGALRPTPPRPGRPARIAPAVVVAAGRRPPLRPGRRNAAIRVARAGS